MNVALQRRLRLAIALFASFAALHIAIPTEIWAVNAASLVTQSNSEGMVTIKVTPQALSTSSTALRFEVILETHTVALTQDLRDAAVLSDGVGNEYKPIA